MIDVYLKLMQQYPDAQWISQRYLTREKYQEKMLRDRGHIADGMLIFSDERKIAIEVELTLKGKDRLNQIFKEYVTQFSIHEVWYFCAPKILAKINKFAEEFSFVKGYDLQGFLNL